MTTALHAGRHGDHHGSDTVAELARRHPALVHLARAGWVAKGVVYALLDLLAASLVVGGGTEEEVSQSGAVAKVAEAPLGGLALWAVAVGLVLYVVWRVVSILLPHPAPRTTASSPASTRSTSAGRTRRRPASAGCGRGCGPRRRPCCWPSRSGRSS